MPRTPTRQLYYGPHLHAALKCMDAGRPDNAVTWMWRDIGETTDDMGEYPDEDSLNVVDVPPDDPHAIQNHTRIIEYLPTGPLQPTKEDMKKDLKELIALVAQADTGGALGRINRGGILVDAAKQLTDEYGFFKYWG